MNVNETVEWAGTKSATLRLEKIGMPGIRMLE